MCSGRDRSDLSYREVAPAVDIRERVASSVEARRALAANDRERESIDAFLAAFAGLERPFDESADVTHVTGSGIVVSERGVLLHKHKRLGIWLQPGGHVDDGEAPWDAARRETIEETGLVGEFPYGVPTLFHVDVHPGPRGHTHLDLRYLLVAEPDDPAPPEGESQEVAWFAVPDALAFADVGLVGPLMLLAGGAARGLEWPPS